MALTCTTNEGARIRHRELRGCDSCAGLTQAVGHAGGRFSITGSVIGAIIIKTLDITIYTVGVPTNTTLLFKALVVIVLSLAQAPAFRARVFGRRRQPSLPVQPTPKAEVPA